MNQLPSVDYNYQDLYKILMGPLKTKLMMTAVEMGVFNQLKDFRSSDEVADTLETHPDNTRRFLDALATIDLVEKTDGMYRNHPIAQSFLTEDSPVNLGPMFQLMLKWSIDPLDNLHKLVKDGPMPSESSEDFDSEALWARSAKDSAAWALGEMGRKIGRIVSKLPGFPGFQKMLDLGGGHGIFALYIVNAHPEMKGIVFDRPAVLEVAKGFIQQYGMTGRVDVKAGDYMADDLGSDYDLIWASATLNFAKDRIDELVSKIFDSLKPGGYFISFQDGMTHEHTKPAIMLGHLADKLQGGIDFSLEQGFVADAAIRCGFLSVRSRTIETPMGPMDLDIARK